MIGLDRYFPPAFGRIRPKWGTPYVAILVHAILASVFLVLISLGKGSAVERVYLVLLSTMVLIYFIPFIYLFLAYIVLRNNRVVPIPIGLAGLFLTVFAMILAVIPPPGTGDPWIYELKIGWGASAFVGAGLWLYWRAQRRSARDRQHGSGEI